MPYRFLEETVTPVNDVLDTVAVSNGGTGYAVDDILTINGGTGTSATVRVTSVSGGVIDGVQVETGGNYSSNPTSPNSPTGGSGTGASLTITLDQEKGYVMAMKALYDALKAGHVTITSLVSGGSGYVVGDILTIDAGANLAFGTTAQFTARVEVTAAPAGVITEFEMRSSGGFSTLPNVTTASHATTGGTGTGATFSVDAVEGPYSAAPNAGGSGYSVGDIITVTGGTLQPGESALQFIVTAVNSGAVTSLAPYRIGQYSALPSSPAATTGGGSGLTVDLTHASWREPEATDSQSYTDNLNEFSWWLEGVNDAGGEPLVGMRAISDGANRWIGLKTATGFDNSLTFENQPGASPGDYTDPATDGGARLPSVDSAVTVFAAWTPRTLNVVFRSAPVYEHGYLGLYLPFIDSPATKYAFPLICAGTCSSDTINVNSPFQGRNINQEPNVHCSILHHGEGSATGPHLLRDVSGSWRPFESEQSLDDAMRLWPVNGDYGNATPTLPPNIESGSGTVGPWSGTAHSELLDGQSGTTSSGPFNGNASLGPTPFGDGGDDLYFMVAPLLYEIQGATVQLYGELEGCFMINGRGLAAEDRIKDSAGNRYFVFTDTASNENRNFIALREGRNAV